MKNLQKSLLTPMLLFALASIMTGLYTGLYDSSFNNFLDFGYQISEITRGALEFPREFPGFLIVFVITALLFMTDSRIASLSALLIAASFLGQSFLAPGVGTLVIWMVLWSVGTHLYMCIAPCISLRLASEGKEGSLLGKLASLESLGSLLGMLIVFVGASHFHFSFQVLFTIACVCALLAAVALFLIKPEPVRRQRQLILKKKYTVFYILNIFFGARKQIFLTFAPWVLIKVFHAEVSTFAILGIIGTILSLFFRPILGRAIDALGEKKIIAFESISLIVVCIFYGCSEMWFAHSMAKYVIMACYITDQILFSVRIARTTYLNRIADHPDEIAPTFSMGVTMDHAVAMLIPFAGGLLWAQCGYMWLFLAAALLAFLNLIAALFITDRKPMTDTV